MWLTVLCGFEYTYCIMKSVTYNFQLAKKYHPDVSKSDPDNAKKFQEMSEAYEVTIINIFQITPSLSLVNELLYLFNKKRCVQVISQLKVKESFVPVTLHLSARMYL